MAVIQVEVSTSNWQIFEAVRNYLEFVREGVPWPKNKPDDQIMEVIVFCGETACTDVIDQIIRERGGDKEEWLQQWKNILNLLMEVTVGQTVSKQEHNAVREILRFINTAYRETIDRS